MALGSTQPLSRMNAASISCVGEGCTGGLISFMCRLSGYFGGIEILEPKEAVQACKGAALPQPQQYKCYMT